MFEEVLTELFGEAGIAPIARILLFILVIVITWFAQRIVRRLIVIVTKSVFGITTRIGKVGFPFEEQLNHALTRPTQLFVVVLGLRIALAFVGLTPLVIIVSDRVTLNLLTFAVFWILYRVTNIVALYYVDKAVKDTSPLDETIVRFARQIAAFVIVVFGIVLILQQWGQDVGALIAGLGIASLAVALAAQDALANVIGYFAVVADAPFKVGDFIIVEDMVIGKVQEISFRSTRIRTLDNSLMVIPNRTIANANIVNWARVRKRRLDMIVGVTYSSTPEQLAEAIGRIRAMLSEHDEVTPDRMVVEFVEFGDSSLNLRISFLARSYTWEDLEAVKTEVNLNIMRILKDVGLSVAFPTRTVHLINETPQQ